MGPLCIQVERLFNKMLDRSAAFRDGLGGISDHISLGATLETLWADACGDAPDIANGDAGGSRTRAASAVLRCITFCRASNVLSLASVEHEEVRGGHPGYEKAVVRI